MFFRGLEKRVFYIIRVIGVAPPGAVACSISRGQNGAMKIDEDSRRRDIARVMIDLVANHGLAAATFRRIAEQGGWSTASITNYFVDKQDLLVWTFQQLSTEGEAQFKQALASAGGDPIPALMTMVPWCPANVRRWKAYLAFWDAAVRDDELAALLAQSTRVGTDLLASLVHQASPATSDCHAAAETLNTIVQGIAMQALVDRAGWTGEKIRRILCEAWRGVTPPGG